MLRTVQRCSKHINDFSHHLPNVGRLNNGSFGACPQEVLKVQDDFRKEWLGQPDALYFDIENGLDLRLQRVETSIANYLNVESDNISIVENATVATSTIAQRWASQMQKKKSKTNKTIMIFNHIYGACKYSLKHHCEPFGGKIIEVNIPFPIHDKNEVLRQVEMTLMEHTPQYCFLDHITSQPAIVLPIKEIIEMCRTYASTNVEIAVDGSHAIGSIHFDHDNNNNSGGVGVDDDDANSYNNDVESYVDTSSNENNNNNNNNNTINLEDLDCDFYFSNLHKWAMTPTSATFLYYANDMKNTNHAIISWPYGENLSAESRWPGTKDFSAYIAVPTALEYLQNWRSTDNRNAIDYNKEECWKQATMLTNAWETSIGVPEDMSSSMTMIKLPERLIVNDIPGMPTKGVRSTLRDEYNLEVAIGNFGPDIGNYIRLSHAIYNQEEEFERLRDAILELAGPKK